MVIKMVEKKHATLSRKGKGRAQKMSRFTVSNFIRDNPKYPYDRHLDLQKTLMNIGKESRGGKTVLRGPFRTGLCETYPKSRMLQIHAPIPHPQDDPDTDGEED
jgi:hypothetical protein